MKIKNIAAVVLSTTLILSSIAGCSTGKIDNDTPNESKPAVTASAKVKGEDKKEATNNDKFEPKKNITDTDSDKLTKDIGTPTPMPSTEPTDAPDNKSTSTADSFTPEEPFKLLDIKSREGDNFKVVGIDPETQAYNKVILRDSLDTVLSFLIENYSADSTLISATVDVSNSILGSDSKTATENRDEWFNTVLGAAKSSYNNADKMSQGKVFKTYTNDVMSALYTETNELYEDGDNSYQPTFTVAAFYNLDSYHILRVDITAKYFVNKGDSYGMDSECESLLNDVLKAYNLSDIKTIATDVEL